MPPLPALDPTLVTVIAYLFAGLMFAVGSRRPKPGAMGEKIKTATAETQSAPVNSNGRRQEMAEDRIRLVEERLTDHDKRFERLESQNVTNNNFMLTTTLTLDRISRRLDDLIRSSGVKSVVDTAALAESEGRSQ